MFLISSLSSKTIPITSRFIQFQSFCTSPDQKLSKKQFRSKNHKIVDYVKVQGEILYGINPLMMALEAEKRHFHQIYYNAASKRTKEIIEAAAFRGIPCQKSERGVLGQLAKQSSKEVGVHQGICADVDPIYPEVFQTSHLEDTNEGQLYLFLCRLSDPFNLGAVLRSAYFLGVDRVLTSSFITHSAPLTPVVSKASSGVLEIFTPELVRCPETFLQLVRDKGNWTIMASGLPTDDGQVGYDVYRDGNVIVRDVSKDDKNKVVSTSSRNVLLLVGNEGFGIPKELLDFCDKNVILGSNRKLHRNVDSLNVSVATALIIQFLKNKYIQ